MHSNRSSFRSPFIILQESKRGVPFIPGLALLILGVVLVVAPRLVLAAVAACLFIFGALLCFIAYKFLALRKQVSQLAKSMEGSLYSGSFKTSKPDIDVTDSDNTKIIYH